MIILTSDTCEPCKVIKTVLGERGDISFLNLNTQEGVDMARKYGVRSVPTLIKDGKVVTGQHNIFTILGVCYN